MSDMSSFSRLVSIKSGQDLELPFDINTQQSQLSCHEILRLLPSKRLVCKGLYQEKIVVLKIFFGQSYKRRYQRELDGVNLIKQAGISTPQLIASELDVENNLAYLVFEYIEQAVTLDDEIKQAQTAEQRLAVFKQALLLIAQMHQASIYQRDVHLDNFLCSQKKAVFNRWRSNREKSNGTRFSRKISDRQLGNVFYSVISMGKASP